MSAVVVEMSDSRGRMVVWPVLVKRCVAGFTDGGDGVASRWRLLRHGVRFAMGLVRGRASLTFLVFVSPRRVDVFMGRRWGRPLAMDG